ncbi:BppU family phage baseplate upper protein [Bacillus infantis]|uniref:BppU family phage baseplate upper protein n=1 Tax=Bacillus infantis TaxID=324767 RepID=UPI003CEA15E0
METLKKTSMTIDLKQTTMIPMPQFIQQDTNVLEFEIKENGESADLSNIGRIVVNYKRPDGKVISRLLTVEENTVSYSIGVEEMQVAGFAEIELQFYSKDNLQRISTKRFKVSMSQEIGTREIGDTEGTLTILQELFVEVESLVADTEAAAQHANDEAEYARAKGNYADEKAKLAATEASNLETLKADVVDATNAANTAAADATSTAQGAATEAVNIAESAATEAKQTADTAAANADEKAALAKTQADYAKEQGDIAKQKQAELQGLSVVQYNDRLVKVENELSDSNRQSQNLQHGIQVINASADSLADFEIAGRTLIPMASTPLRGGMFYVLADKRTIIAIDGQRKQGVTKFQKATTATTTTATFAGKVAGSTAGNPHVAYIMQAGKTLMTPTTLGQEVAAYSDPYGKMSVLDGSVYGEVQQESGGIPQLVYAFNIIEQIERNMGGRVPGATTAAKVQWLKDNVETMNFNWHGYGRGSSGSNKATVAVWDNNSSGWLVNATHSLAASNLLTITSTGAGNRVNGNGIAHFIAYGNASDGNAFSSLYTDYLELVITLKAGAQLDTRPQIIRIANFQDKVAGSTVENPHVAYAAPLSLQGLPTPSQATFEVTGYPAISALGGGSYPVPRSNAGAQGHTVFSFNLIEEIERNVGKIPKSTVADKVQWLKDNLAKLTCNWWGYGSSVGGNKASLASYKPSTSNWYTQSVNLQNYALLRTTTNVSQDIDSSGFSHFLAYAEPSDGQTASTINTDYVELEIELKPGADIHHPVVPLYEVTQAEYDNILVAWDEMAVLSRYPKVQGMQHLQNPAVIAEGENLLPPFYEWYTNANTTIKGPYEFELNATGDAQTTMFTMPAIVGKTYSFSVDEMVRMTIIYLDDKGAEIAGGTSVSRPYNYTTAKTGTFTVPSGVHSFQFRLGNQLERGIFKFKNPMLTLRDKPKPFVPRNPSYLFAQVKLGQIGDKKDILFRQDDNWMVRKEIEKDIVLDSSFAWKGKNEKVGFKNFYSDPIFTTGFLAPVKVTSYTGKLFGYIASASEPETAGIYNDGRLYTSVLDSETGFGEDFNPTTDDIKRYFNGWKYQDGITWISVTGNGQTATAATALTTKPTDYVPYKLSYVLATPQMVNVAEKVEGDIAVNGQTQVEVTSGVVVREKVTPRTTVGFYRINHSSLGTQLANKSNRLFNVYKNKQLDSKWTLGSGLASVYYGGGYATLPDADFDPTAEYTVTYLVLDRHLFTVNATEVKVFFDKSMKSVVDKLVEKEADNATLLSVHARTIYEMLVRIKRLEG